MGDGRVDPTHTVTTSNRQPATAHEPENKQTRLAAAFALHTPTPCTAGPIAETHQVVLLTDQLPHGVLPQLLPRHQHLAHARLRRECLHPRQLGGSAGGLQLLLLLPVELTVLRLRRCCGLRDWRRLEES